MLVVGITGGIGCGKSTAANAFANLGVPILDLDDIAHQLTRPSTPAVEEIAARLGQNLLKNDGSLDRTALRELVFRQPATKQVLESILHPRILLESRGWLAQITNQPYAILVIPLIFENPQFRALVDWVVTLDCSEQVQIDRVMKRSGLSEEMIRAIMATQIDAQTRKQMSDGILNNQGNSAELARAVEKMHQELLARSKNVR